MQKSIENSRWQYEKKFIKTYLERSETSMMKVFYKNISRLLAINSFRLSSIIRFQKGPKYVSEME